MNSIARPRLAALAAAITLLSAAGAQAALVTNGSFEAAGPNLAAGGGSYCYLNFAALECGSVPGWAGVFPVMSSTSSPWGNPSGLAGWNASFGAVQIGLQNASYATQALALAAGHYQLQWSDAGRRGYQPEKYEVWYGTDLLGTFDTVGGQGWATHTLNFTAAGADTLKFQGLAVSADGTAFIDNVSVTAAVPEPSSVLLLAGAMGALSVVRRRASR